MAERVYPATKPQTVNGTTTTTTNTNPSFPTTKSQLYGATRPVYRPQPRRHRRSCCCSCCLWLTLFILLLLLIAATASAIFYLIYRPHRPSFSVTTLKISQLNLTSSSALTTKLNLTLSAKNPNKKLVFIYDPMSITVSSSSSSSHDVILGSGIIPAFLHGKKNTTAMRTSITGSQSLDDTSATSLRSDMKTKGGFPLKVEVNTKVKVKVGGLKTDKIKIRVTCDGIKSTVPTGKTLVTASTSDAKCKVDLRIKIWKWTF